jgi:hypothetical protein
LSQRSGIEGFLVIASQGKGKFDAFNGGSHLGERFLDMFSTNNDPCQQFIDFVKGHTVVKTLTGIEPPPVVTVKKKGPKPREIINSHDKGSIANNVAFIRDKLNKAIGKVNSLPHKPSDCLSDHLIPYFLFSKDEAAPGKFARGWPGTNTREKLQAAGVSLVVHQNDLRVNALDFCLRPGDMRDKHSQRVVAALEENWVELRVESTHRKSPNSVGFEITNTKQSSVKRISVGRCQVPQKSANTPSRKKQKLSKAFVDDGDMDSTHNDERSNLNADNSESSTDMDPEDEGETDN